MVNLFEPGLHWAEPGWERCSDRGDRNAGSFERLDCMGHHARVAAHRSNRDAEIRDPHGLKQVSTNRMTRRPVTAVPYSERCARCKRAK